MNDSPSLDDVVDFIYSEMENVDPIGGGLPQIDVDQWVFILVIILFLTLST